MVQWILTDEYKKGVASYLSQHPTDDKMIRISELLRLKEMQIQSFSCEPLDGDSYEQMKADLAYLKGTVKLLCAHDFSFSREVENQMYQIILKTFSYKQVSGDRIPSFDSYYVFINQFNGYQDILRYSFEKDLAKEDYVYLRDSYHAYLEDLLKYRAGLLRQTEEEHFMLRQNPFDVLYHLASHKQNFAVNEEEYQELLKFCSSYEKKYLEDVKKRCINMLSEELDDSCYLNAARTLKLTVEAIAKSKN